MTTTHDAPASAITPIPRTRPTGRKLQLHAVDRAALVNNPQPPATVVASVEARFWVRPGWRHPTSALVSYLKFLDACGYGLSELEAKLAASWEGTESDNQSASFRPGNSPGSAGVVAGPRTLRGQLESRPDTSASSPPRTTTLPITIRAAQTTSHPSTPRFRPFPPFPPPADTTSSVWPSIDPIRLLHTCGIRGGSGSPEGGDDGPPALCWVRNEIRSTADGSRP